MILPSATTSDGVLAALRFHARNPLSTHLEIETYTWDVLPAQLKDGDIVDYVVRELQFVEPALHQARSEAEQPTESAH